MNDTTAWPTFDAATAWPATTKSAPSVPVPLNAVPENGEIVTLKFFELPLG